MLRRFFVVTALFFGACTLSCGQTLDTELAGQAEQQVQAAPENVLVVYYSKGGQSKRVAKLVAEDLKASLYEIKTAKPYDPNNAKEDREKGLLPEIRGKLPGLKKVNRVILVFPVWGYTVCQPMQKFLSKVDLTGKQVDVVTVSVGRLGGVYDRVQEMIKGAAIQKTNNVAYPARKSDADLKKILSKWNTGAVPKRISLTKGIEINRPVLTEIEVDDHSFALFLPRTTKWSNSSSAPADPIKPTDPSPGVLTISPRGQVMFNGVRVGKAVKQLPKGTFEPDEPITLF